MYGHKYISAPRDYERKFRTARIVRGGNSYGIYIPRDMLRALDWGVGDHVFVYIVNSCVVVQKCDRDNVQPRVMAAMDQIQVEG